jgi:hypothetical protein
MHMYSSALPLYITVVKCIQCFLFCKCCYSVDHLQDFFLPKLLSLCWILSNVCVRLISKLIHETITLKPLWLKWKVFCCAFDTTVHCADLSFHTKILCSRRVQLLLDLVFVVILVERKTGTNWLGGWVVTSAGRGTVEKRKTSIPCLE